MPVRLIGRMKLVAGILFSLIFLMGTAVAEVEKKIDSELVKTFEAAFRKLPETLQKELDDVTLRRSNELGIPEELPLEYQLLKRAAYASFSVLDREVTIYDAGAENRPSWEDEGPSKAALAKLLAGVADVMGVEAPKDGNDPAFQAAWSEFVKRVYSWKGEERPGEIPEVDDREFWGRFLGGGVTRLLGEEVPMEQMLFHEFGHALQLNRDLMFSSMKHWAELSGVVETENRRPTNGFVGGMQKLEEVMVLIRLLMSDDPESMTRGEKADYQPSSKARFLNRYARYDLREDYAESFRKMAYEPGRLAKVAPEKFLYLNALGWNARGDLQNPGPLWYSGEEFLKYLPKESRKAIFARLLGKDQAGLDLTPAPLAAILRAHAAELSADDLPEPHPVVPVPEDASEQMKKFLQPRMIAVEVDGVVHTSSPDRQREKQNNMIVNEIENFDFAYSILKFRDRSTAGMKGAYEKGVVESKNSMIRLHSYEALREYGSELITAEQWREWDQKEAKYHQENGSAWSSSRYALLASGKEIEELYREFDEAAESDEKGFERALFIATAVDLALRGDDPKIVEARIRKIPGKTLGAWLRGRYAMRAAKKFDEKQFRKIVEEEIEACRFSEVKSALQKMLESDE